MAYQPLTPQQFKSAKAAGFSPDKIIQMEQVRKAKETVPVVPHSSTPYADMIPHSSYNESNGPVKTIIKAVGNIPHEVGASVENIARLPGATYNAVTDPNVQAHPLAAVSGALGSMWDSVVKPALKAGMTLGRTIEGGLQAGIKKVTGADIGSKDSQNAWDNVVPNAIDTVKSVQKSLVEHPLVTASMAEATLPKGTTASGTLAKVTAPVTAPVRNAVADRLKKSAEADVNKVLSPTTKPNKITASKVAPQLLDRPVGDTFALTRKGLEEKAVAGKESAGNAINDYGDIKGSTKTGDVVGALESEKAQYSAGGKVVNQDAVDKIKKVQDIIAQYGDTIDNNTLRDVRRIFDTEIQRSKGFQLPPSEGSLIDAKKVASDKIRGILADAHPDLAKLNKEYTFWSNLNKVIGDTNTRTTGQSGLIDNLATMGGALSGHGAIDIAAKALTFRWIAAGVRSTGWRLASARVKNSLADAIASDDFEKANNVLAVMKILPKYTEEWKALQKGQTPNASQTTQTNTPMPKATNIPKRIPPIQ